MLFKIYQIIYSELFSYFSLLDSSASLNNNSIDIPSYPHQLTHADFIIFKLQLSLLLFSDLILILLFFLSGSI